ncbi:MAG: preprotein translocase subunit SecG [Ignavibacteria bacterium]|nr:preprotein translocase subunit SecG [Ignavibacteria bacterium]
MSLYTLLVSLSVLIAIVLVIVVLLQSSKGGGLSGAISGTSMGTMFGARRTADILSKVTWWLGGLLVVLALAINLFLVHPESKGQDAESIIQQSKRQAPTSAPVAPPSPSNVNP